MNLPKFFAPTITPQREWTPLLDRILILRDPAPVLHPDTGLEIPDGYREQFRPNTGVVAALGPGRRYQDGIVHPIALSIGERVLYNVVGGSVVSHAGVEHLLVSEADIFLRLNA